MSLAAVLFAIVVAAAGCNTGGGQSPTTGATTGGTSPSADGSAASPSADGTDEESASPDDSGSPSSGGTLEASGDIFGFGMTREQADEIATVRMDYFEEKYPDVNLTVSETDFSPEGFLAALASDDPPDVVRLGRDVIGTYVARDTLLPLNDCMERAGLDPGLFYESPLNAVTIDGEVYGIPEAMDTRNWLVNDAAFEEAGLGDPADFDWSDWDAISSASEALFEGEGSNITRLGIDPKIPEFLALWAKANGADLLSEDGMTSQLEDPKVAEALQFTVDLINAQGGRDPFLNFRGTWDFFGAENQFAADQVGAHPMEQWYLNVLAGGSPEAPISVQPFQDREGNGLTLEGGSAMAVTKASSNPDAACALVTAMAETEGWVAAVEERVRLREEAGEANTGTFPANREANEQIFSEVVDLDSELLPAQFKDAVNTVLENQENAFAIPGGPANGPIFGGDNSIVAQAVARVLDGEDAQEVLTQADEEAQAAIDAAAQGQ
jgi:multiple sugar transport system substrate-binding protein